MNTRPTRTHEYKKSVEVVSGAAPSTLGETAMVLLAAMPVALALGSKALLGWANGLPISPASDYILYLAQGWHDAMTAIGVSSFADTIRTALQNFQSMR